jgi:hypothetical protein
VDHHLPVYLIGSSGRLTHGRERAEHRLYLVEIDPYTASFHGSIAPSREPQTTTVVQIAEIPCPEDRDAIGCRESYKRADLLRSVSATQVLRLHHDLAGVLR